MPTEKHSDFMNLGEEDKKTVWRLAAILRLADGLDKACGGENLQNLEITHKDRDVFFEVATANECDLEIAQERADMFETAFDCRVVFMRRPTMAKV